MGGGSAHLVEPYSSLSVPPGLLLLELNMPTTLTHDDVALSHHVGQHLPACQWPHPGKHAQPAHTHLEQRSLFEPKGWPLLQTAGPPPASTGPRRPAPPGACCSSCCCVAEGITAAAGSAGSGRDKLAARAAAMSRSAGFGLGLSGFKTRVANTQKRHVKPACCAAPAVSCFTEA